MSVRAISDAASTVRHLQLPMERYRPMRDAMLVHVRETLAVEMSAKTYLHYFNLMNEANHHTPTLILTEQRHLTLNNKS